MKDDKMDAAILCRVSKSEGQETIQQEDRCIAEAKALGVNVVEKYIYNGSGGSVGENDVFLKLLKDADAHKFKLLIMFSLDRFSREGIGNTLGYIKRLKLNGVAIKSISEPWLNTVPVNGIDVSEILLSVMSWVAEADLKRIKEKTKLKLDYYQAQIKEKGYYITKAGVKKTSLGRGPGVKDEKKVRAKSGYHQYWASDKGKLRRERMSMLTKERHEQNKQKVGV